jgi:hypothetical protein
MVATAASSAILRDRSPRRAQQTKVTLVGG